VRAFVLELLAALAFALRASLTIALTRNAVPLPLLEARSPFAIELADQRRGLAHGNDDLVKAAVSVKHTEDACCDLSRARSSEPTRARLHAALQRAAATWSESQDAAPLRRELLAVLLDLDAG
jgi:hypothetical protein